MRIGWSTGAGPVRVGGTLWRSKKRKPAHRVMSCGHAHRTSQAYASCPQGKALAEQRAAAEAIAIRADMGTLESTGHLILIICTLGLWYRVYKMRIAKLAARKAIPGSGDRK